MHLTLKKEATKPASFNFLQQQERFDRSSRFTTTSVRTKPSAARILAICIHLPRASTSRRLSLTTRITIARSA